MSDQNLRKRKLEILEILETIRTIIQCNIFIGLTIVCFLFFKVQKYKLVYEYVFTVMVMVNILRKVIKSGE